MLFSLDDFQSIKFDDILQGSFD